MLTIAYAAGGALALLVALPPGYVSPLYPPAGIALAAVLVYGWRMSASIYVGTCLVHVLSYLHTGISDLISPVTVALSALGPPLQALFGAWLLRRLKVWPGGLDSVRSVVLFVGIATPLSCLISPTAAGLAPLAEHASDFALTASSWSSWWAGDTLGILLFAPISLALIGLPIQEWRGRRRSVAFPLLISTLVLGIALTFVRQREETRIATDFQRDAEHLASSLETRLAAQTDMLMTMEHFVSVSRALTREDWKSIASPWLERYPGTKNLTWNPLVTRASRAAFESHQRADGQPDFRIRYRDVAGNLLPAEDTAEHLPITFVEPLAGNEKALGVDVLSLAPSAQAIRLSRETGRAAATEAIRLVQTPDSPQSVVVYQAIFERDGDPTSPLRGVTSMAMQMDNIVRFARERLQNDGLELCIADRSNAPERQRIYGAVGCSQPDWLKGHLFQTHQVGFADREWQFLLRARDSYSTSARSWASSAALLTALCFSAMLSGFLLLITGRTRRIEVQVTQRTAELASATAQLRDQKASLAQAQRIARMGSWEIASGTSHLQCSDEFRRLLHLPASGRILLSDVLTRLSLNDHDHLNEAIKAACRGPESFALDCHIPDDDERTQILHFQIESEWMMGRLLRVHGTAQNVTDIREAAAHIQHLARFDTLTGLPNRTYWQELAHTALGTARRHHDQAAVLFLDLDHFKTINDSLGHTVGDELLACVASRLKQCLRGEDVLARQGGDEFVLLLPRLQHFEEVSAVASKLVKSLAEPIKLEKHELSISVSVGIAYFPGDGDDIDTLLKHADVAMYSAKQTGRNNFQFFVPEMNQRAMLRLKMESALRRGIERGELILHYQPQMVLADGHIEGVEALVRWQHPEQGMVPPVQFIPLAEETGLILPLGDWVMREACAQQARWAAAGIPLTMAINISALQFQQADFPQRVGRIIAETGADPHRIELEITESALLDSTEDLVERLERVRALGVTLALDDFGTGYSCLAYLKRLPIERLKIDRSFVKDLPGDAEDAAIASATLSMARDLGMDVVAEGVENAAQHDYLLARRCRSIQGYFVCKPLPAAELGEWLWARLNSGTSTP
ncbi:MAG: diguanylate cyclase [Proteobacteria bacterium]|nr:diguanylate cyclase [Pseudomonadota bacterium]